MMGPFCTFTIKHCNIGIYKMSPRQYCLIYFVILASALVYFVFSAFVLSSFCSANHFKYSIFFSFIYLHHSLVEFLLFSIWFGRFFKDYLCLEMFLDLHIHTQYTMTSTKNIECNIVKLGEKKDKIFCV